MPINSRSWQYTRIKDIQEIKPRNGLYKSASKSGNNIHRWIKMKDLYQNMVIRDSETETISVTDTEAETFSCLSGDLLFGRTSLVLDGVGTCSIVGDIKDTPVFESNLFRIRLNTTKTVPLFYLYYFRSPFGRQEVKKIAKHTAAASITGTDLIEIEIPYPPLTEQRAIASILGSLDDKIELNRRVNVTLEEMARAMFRRWFLENESNWEEKSLDEIANFLNGLALQKFPVDGENYLPVIKIAQLRKNETKDADRASTNIPPERNVSIGLVQLFSEFKEADSLGRPLVWAD